MDIQLTLVTEFLHARTVLFSQTTSDSETKALGQDEQRVRKRIKLCFPGGSDGKESAYSAGDLGLIHRLGRPPERERGNPLQYSCLENPHGQKSLAGHSPKSHKESDLTEQLAS